MERSRGCGSTIFTGRTGPRSASMKCCLLKSFANREGNKHVMKRIIYWYVLSFFVLHFYESSGQQILFRNYAVSEGLPSSTVRAIMQDDQGYMWFGTKN